MTFVRAFIFCLYNLLLITAVVLVMRACFTPVVDPVVVTRKEIRYNTVYRDRVTPEEQHQALLCYDQGVPELDIQQGTGSEFVLSAGLCERKWQRVVNIQPRGVRNMVIASGMFNSRLMPGASVQYYRLFGKFGAGGGYGLCRDGPSFVQAGILYMW